MSIATVEIQPRVANVVLDETTLTVAIADGRVVMVPLDWYPRLLHATPAERQAWRIFEDSNGRDIIFWEELDELVPLVALLTGTPSRESPHAFEQWLAKRHTN